MKFPVPTSEEIRIHLQEIFESEDFKSSDLLKKFLNFITEETLQGKKNQLKAYTVALELYGNNNNFDPQINPAIRVAAGRLRSKLEHYYYVNPKGKVKIELKKGNYYPVFHYNNSLQKIDTPKLTDTADCYDAKEININDNLIEQNNSFSDNPIEDSNSLELNNSKINKNVSSEASVAIFPFVNKSNELVLDYFIDGILEEIVISLTKFKDLTIFNVHLTEENNYKNQSAYSEIAKKLNARFILHGSIQLNTDIIRIRVMLTDSLTLSELWAEKFEGDLNTNSLFTIQDIITEKIVASLGGSFGLINKTLHQEKDRKRPEELTSYEAVLYYHYWLAALVPERMIQAKNALEQAIVSEPNYVIALSMLSDLYAAHVQWGFNLFGETLERSQFLADQAFSIDPNCQYAQWAKAYNYFLRFDTNLFFEYAQNAVNLNPSNASIIGSAGLKMSMAGNWEQGLTLVNKAMNLSPNRPNWYGIAPATYYYLQGKYDQAFEETKKISMPGFIGGPLLRIAILGKLSKFKEAETYLKNLYFFESFTTDPQKLINRIFYYEESINSIWEGLNLCLKHFNYK